MKTRRWIGGDNERELTGQLDAAHRLLELGTECLVEQRDDVIYPRILDTALVLLRASAACLHVVGTDGELQLVAQCGDVDGTRTTSTETKVLRAREGVPLGALSIYWDVSHEPSRHDVRVLDTLARQAAGLLERRQTEQALRDADERKDRFLATLAHELRNPLAPILTGVEVIRMSESRDVREAMRAIIEEQSRHLVRLVDDLLDVGRIKAGKIELDLARHDLASVVQTAITTTTPALKAGRHQLVVDLPDSPIELDADRTRLAQILTNLLSNAARYTPPGGTIKLSARVDRDDAVLEVADNGIGIASDMLGCVFDMFVQSTRSEGLGIGLSLVKSLVELHGGQVRAYSDGLGRGSRFEVRLPLLSPEHPAR